MNLNNKGFTLIEVLAVVVILSILVTIMVPNVNQFIIKNKKDNYENLKEGILQSAKIYLSDNRYEITLERKCNNTTEEINITHIKGIEINSKLPIELLINSKDLSTTTDENGNAIIINPTDESQILDLTNSYVLVKYQCSNKDYNYTLEEDSLKWKTR